MEELIKYEGGTALLADNAIKAIKTLEQQAKSIRKQ